MSGFGSHSAQYLSTVENLKTDTPFGNESKPQNESLSDSLSIEGNYDGEDALSRSKGKDMTVSGVKIDSSLDTLNLDDNRLATFPDSDNVYISYSDQFANNTYGFKLATDKTYEMDTIDIFSIADDTGIMDDQTGVMIDQTGVMNDQTGVMNDQKGKVRYQTGVMDSQIGAMDVQAGVVNGQKGLLDNQTGVVDDQTGVVDDQTCEVDDQIGVVDDQTGVVDDQIVVVDGQTGVVDDQMSEVPVWGNHHDNRTSVNRSNLSFEKENILLNTSKPVSIQVITFEKLMFIIVFWIIICCDILLQLNFRQKTGIELIYQQN